MLLTFQSPLEHLKGLIALEKEQRSKWDQGPKMGWANLDERPYLSLKYNLAKFYLSNSMKRFAIKEFEEILGDRCSGSHGSPLRIDGYLL